MSIASSLTVTMTKSVSSYRKTSGFQKSVMHLSLWAKDRNISPEVLIHLAAESTVACLGHIDGYDAIKDALKSHD